MGQGDEQVGKTLQGAGFWTRWWGGPVSLSRGPDVTATDTDLENPGCFCSVGFSALMRRRKGDKVGLVSAVVRHSP